MGLIEPSETCRARGNDALWPVDAGYPGIPLSAAVRGMGG